MDFTQFGKIQKIRGCIEEFKSRHPRFPLFIRAVAQEAVREGTIIEIKVTTEEGREYCTNVKLQAEDVELMEYVKNMV